MTNLPISYAAAALYGLGIEAGLPDFMGSEAEPAQPGQRYEQSEDNAREREQAEAELNGPTAPLNEDGGFRHPCPLRDLLA